MKKQLHFNANVLIKKSRTWMARNILDQRDDNVIKYSNRVTLSGTTIHSTLDPNS